MDVWPSLVSHFEPTKSIQPRKSALHYPAVATESLTRLNPSTCDTRDDAASSQCLPTAREVVSLVCVQLVWPLPRPSPGPTNRRDGIYRCFQQHRVMHIGPRLRHCEGNSFSVDHKVALRARFATIRRVRAGFRAPPGAGTLAESNDARDQSIWSASPRRFSSIWWILCQIPASCQSRKRRQQVMPLPHPISWGSNSQGMPVRKTKRIPMRAARAGTGGRPPFGLGRSGGSSGATISHNSSGKIGLAIHLLYTKTRFC
jgi:hypothetical protein